MNNELRQALAEYLQEELHRHCSGYMFSVDDVLNEIDEFFDKEVCNECGKEKMMSQYLGVCGPCYTKNVGEI